MRKQPKRIPMSIFRVIPAGRQHRGWNLCWVEGGKVLTTCVGCDTLMAYEAGPRCPGCAENRAVPARMRRRRWKLDRARALAGIPKPVPRPRGEAAGSALSDHPATLRGPSGTSGSRIGEGAFGRTGAVQSGERIARGSLDGLGFLCRICNEPAVMSFMCVALCENPECFDAQLGRVVVPR